VSRPNTTSFPFQAPDISLGEFRLLPDHPAWRRMNDIGESQPLIAIPRTAVAIHQEGRPRVVADPMRAVLYPAGQLYRREVVSADGDRCSFITFSHALAADAAREFDTAAADPVTYRFPFVAAPIATDVYVLQHRTRRLVESGTFDPDEVREALYWIVASLVSNGYRAENGACPKRRSATQRAHRDAIDSIRSRLGQEPSTNVSLDELAASVHLSPFHLTRLFRQQAGRSIHAYRTEVRLRASLDQLADGRPISDVALEVGFASHAHFTDRFRRAYGVTPQTFRQMSKRVIARSGVGRIA
jgi:AraC-like DNA-binding protein